jgi:hypothetical protein
MSRLRVKKAKQEGIPEAQKALLAFQHHLRNCPTCEEGPSLCNIGFKLLRDAEMVSKNRYCAWQTTTSDFTSTVASG